MVGKFEDADICFQYPENWRLEREETENGWSVTLQSPDTAFLVISLSEDKPEPKALADAALTALREEYPDLEADAKQGAVAGQPAVGHDIRFISLDLTNSCWTRSFHGPRGTMLLMWQANDLELEKSEPVLRAICASLEVRAKHP